MAVVARAPAAVARAMAAGWAIEQHPGEWAAAEAVGAAEGPVERRQWGHHHSCG